MPEQQKPSESKKKKPGWLIFGEFIGLFIGIAVTFWAANLSFTTDDYYAWLPIAVIAAAINAIFSSIGHLYTGTKVKQAADSVALAASLYSTVMLLRIFPLDLAEAGLPRLNNLIKLGLTAVVFAVLIALVVNLIKLASKTIQINSKK